MKNKSVFLFFSKIFPFGSVSAFLVRFTCLKVEHPLSSAPPRHVSSSPSVRIPDASSSPSMSITSSSAIAKSWWEKDSKHWTELKTTLSVSGGTRFVLRADGRLNLSFAPSKFYTFAAGESKSKTRRLAKTRNENLLFVYHGLRFRTCFRGKPTHSDWWCSESAILWSWR